MWTAEQARELAEESVYKDELIKQLLMQSLAEIRKLYFMTVFPITQKTNLKGLTIEECSWIDNGYTTKINW